MDIIKATSLKELIQGMMPVNLEVIQGQVTSADPLKIVAINDDKLIINTSLLCIPEHLTDYTTICDITLNSNAGGKIDSKTKKDGIHKHGPHGEHPHGLSGWHPHGESGEHPHGESGGHAHDTEEGATGSATHIHPDTEGTHEHPDTEGAHEHPDTEGTHVHPKDKEEMRHEHVINSFNVFNATIKVHNALKLNEIVWLLSFNQGKKYYVLDRERR